MVKKIIKFIYIFLVFFLLFKVEVFGETLNLNSDKYILYNLNDNNGNMVLPTIKFNNKLDDNNVQYSAVIGSNNNETGANIGMTETRDDNSKSTYRYGFNNGYLRIASKFIVDMENICYHVAAGKISKEFLHEIFESYFDGTFESETMKLKIYEAIS